MAFDPLGTASHIARGTVRAGERLVGARDTAGEQQQAAGAAQQQDMAAYYQSLTPEQMAERARLEAAAAGPTYLQKWESAMPNSYNLGGDANAANAYAAQAQATGGQAQNALNQAAAMSQGVGYEMGSQLAQTGQNYGEAIAGQGMAAGQNLSQYGQDAAAGLASAGDRAQMFGGRQAAALAGQGQAALGYGQGQAGQIGQSAGQLSQMGQGVFGQASSAANRDIIGQQQSGLMGLERQEGPSAAQAQLQSGLNQSQASNLAMARSGRGWGGSAAAMSQAQQQNAAAGQSAANQSAMLRAQEQAAYRARAAQNIAAAGQLGLGQANVNDAQQRALIEAGMQGVQAGGQMQTAAAGVGQNAYAQQLAAQQAAAAAGQAGIGQNLSAQQAAGQLGVGAMQAGGQMQLGALEAGGNLAMGGIEGGGNMQLAGLGQSGNQSGQAALIGLDAQQQAMAAQQQQVANQMAYQNQMIGLHQGNQNYQMNAQNNAAQADAASKDRVDKYAAAGIQFAGSAIGAMSDRNAKKGIEPANKDLLIPSPGEDIDSAAATQALFDRGNPYTPDGNPIQYVQAPNGQIQQVANATNPDGSPYVTRVGQPFNPASDTSGNGGPGGYEFGTGISGPNQMQGAQASNDAAAAASGAAKGKAADAKQSALIGKAQGAAGNFASAIGQGSGFQRQQVPFINFQPTAIPQPMLSDKNEKTGYSLSDERAKEAIESAPGYSYQYKDPGAMGAADGMQFGPMAQDLEKTPAGRSVVKKQPDGTRMVDTSRLTMVNTAALNALAREVDELRARAGKGKAA